MSSLSVTVLSATNLPNVETLSKSDPYCTVEFQGVKKSTKVIEDELNPVWNEKLEFDLQGQALNAGDRISVLVKDHETIGRDRLLGQTDVSLKDLIKGKHEMQVNVNLSDANKRPNSATINLQMTYKPPKAQLAATDSVDYGGVMADGDDDDEEEEEEDAGDTPDGQPKKKKKKTGRGGKRKIRGKYSTKSQDFQIRVKIVEARQLQGANISPVCRVTCWNQLKMTRIKKSTNSPYWGETFFFNFNISPAELFDELMSFSVYNSRRLRSDALIGSFKFDIGMVYEEAGHCFLNKWLLLSDPDDAMAGAKGYLKICAVVLGPGDEAPSFNADAADEEEDDIEANLLRPAGVQLRPATFSLRLYRAEDLPRMDSDILQGVKKMLMGDDKKELVDPYSIFQFAGKEVKSSIKYNNDHPDWNEEMHIGLQFPSMCERIKLQVLDWDRLTGNDPIATTEIILDRISSLSEDTHGFLPTFGPCFVNLYGSPREFSDLPDEYEDLNMGKGEGVAYRGRVLIELSTTLGDTPDESITEIHPDAVQRVQKYLRRRKYRLHAAFLNASMVTSVDAPVEFEVSIGNYGNKLDESVPPCSSTTQPTNAVFDGQFYHFLPWANAKPCTVVESHWEDISFRLQAVNFILRIVDRLETNIEKINVAQKANLPEEEQAQFVISAFDDLILQCGKALPSWEPGQIPQNELDQNIRAVRENELICMKKEAIKVREEATSVESAVNDLDTFLHQLKTLAIEPQNSMPDVVIWMISGEKRIAYYRMPAYDVLWSKTDDYRGRYCGDTQTISLKRSSKLPSMHDDDKWQIPAQLRLKIWLGQEKEENEWHKMQTEGDLSVVAETYENEVSFMGKWCTTGPLMTRPHWSDSSGRVEVPKDTMKLPDGWRWETDWELAPELSLFYDRDAGLSTFLEDVFVNETRMPSSGWQPATQQYTDVKGDPLPPLADTVLPEGWEWVDDWSIDLNRPCDEEGWEYTVEATMGGYVPVEKLYHMCRRRRFIRTRKLKDGMDVQDDKRQRSEKQKEKDLPADGEECWEYAPLFNLKFHAKERKMDMVRRRRWHRKMKPVKSGAPCFFNMGTAEGSMADEKKKRKKEKLAAPRMFLTFKKPHKWQLRAYMYQARDILAGDQSGLSDPYARVVFLNQSQVTERIEKTLCPSWDQTLIFQRVEIHGDPQSIVRRPPKIVVETFDHDQLGEDEFLGRCELTPIVKVNAKDPRRPVLQWYQITKSGRDAGELLAAFELYLVDDQQLPPPPPRRGMLYMVPEGVRPVMQRTGIEILSWGVRNMRKYQLMNVTSPSIEFEIGGHIVSTEIIKNTNRNPNFEKPLIVLDVMLPKEELYMPPMNMRVRDHRQFGRKPMVGLYILKTMDKYRYAPLTEDHDPLAEIPSLSDPGINATDTIIEINEEPEETTGKKKKIDLSALDEDIDWWSKYYASVGELQKCRKYKEMGYDTISVHKSDLEKMENFNNFTDFCTTFHLVRGKNVDEDDDEDNTVGEFKGTFRVYPLPEDRSGPMPSKYLEKGIPDSQPIECIIRVYIIKAIDLQPNDPSGLADPYVEVKLGKKEVDNKDDYIPNSLCPVFGRMFELKCTLPIQKDLEIRIKDYDLLGTDDIIGETYIDLENRYLSKFRGTCGLPRSYCLTGPNQWRDSVKPKEILANFCEKNHLPAPEYDGNTSVRVGRRNFHLSNFERSKLTNPHLGPPEERLALHVLNCLPLVKEHVETRPLYSPLQPGIEQGKLQMWVDIFPNQLGVPGPAIDIRPREPRKYQLRIIIWNTKDVILEEESITGEKMSDIYVKSWIAGIDDKQETDVHYRSLDGEGNFNWRFVFPFEYLPAENAMVVKKKEHFWSLDETEQHLPPNVVVQVWDNDKFSADDFLGTLELNLSHMPAPVKKSRQCNLDQLPIFGDSPKMINLFECHRAYGYWPCYNDETGTAELTGKVEMELELISESEAEAKPAGLGRDEPNENPHLDPPKRPDTSFLWFTSPWKTFKFIVWKNFKYYFITGICVILAALLIVLFIYAIPGLAARRMVLS